MTVQEQLLDFLRQEAAPILNDAFEGMGHARLVHYDQLGPEATRRRLTALFDLTLEAIRTRDLAPVLTYAQETARTRFAEGFDLQEVQTAINVLEEAIWSRVVKTLPAAAMPEALGLVSTVLGVAKDTMGSTYVSEASQLHTTTLDMKSLFKGTQGHWDPRR